MYKSVTRILITLFAIFVVSIVVYFSLKQVHENRILEKIISRFEAESRIAEVLVTAVNYDDKTRELYTTIKFLEYDVNGKPLSPKYFTFSGNIIQFQSLVIRFDDIHIRRGDRFKGKSAYLFWKVFMLNGPNTQEYEITKAYQIPEGYRVENEKNVFEKKLWENFWTYALNPKEAQKAGIKNAQIEAPGTTFIPGMLYTIRIEHDGGMRIDATSLPLILRGERISG